MTLLLLRPLAAGRVRLLLGGLTLSAIGDQLYAVALVWVAVSVFGPAAGYLSALQAACGMVCALFAGRWADRWDTRRAMAGADGVRAGVLLLLVGWWLVHAGPPPAALAAAIVVLAAGEAVFRPALAATLPGLLPDRTLLPAANALFDTVERSARLVGPGLVGVLAGLLPVMHFFTLDAGSFLLSAAAVLGLGRGARAVARPRGPLWRELARGFALVRGHRLLWTVLVTKGPVNGLWVAALSLALPLLIAREGLGLGAYGLVISAYGCTNLFSTLVVGSRPVAPRPARMMFTGMMIVGLGIGALTAGLVGGLPAMMAAAAFAAIGGPMSDIPVAVLRQTELPAGEIAPAMRAFMVMNYCGVLIAMLLAPTLARLIGPGPLIVGCGLGVAALAAYGLARHWSDT